MIKYFSAFAGIGGFDLGIERAIPDSICTGYSEVDKNAIKIYEKHYPDRVNFGDIKKIKTKDLPDFDLFCGGFPCQDVSIAGKRKGLCGARSGLFFEIIRIIRKKQPRYILLENVKGLLSSNKGWDFARILVELGDAGYSVEWAVYNSKNFGVPQNRQRVFIIGHRKDIPFKPVFPLIDKNIGNENDNEVYGIEKVYWLSARISENIRVLSIQRQGEELFPAAMQSLSEKIYEEIQNGESREILIERQAVQQNLKGSIQEVETIHSRVQSSDNTRGFCEVVRLPTQEMLLLWYSGKGFTDNQGCIQQLDLSFINRQNRFIERLHRGEYGSLLLAVQSYKGRLFYSIGDGRDWSKIYCTKMEEKTRTTLNSILEDNPDPKYFLSEKMVKYLIEKRLKGEFSKIHIEGGVQQNACCLSARHYANWNGNYVTNCLTGGGNSGGLHSSMTLLMDAVKDSGVNRINSQAIAIGHTRDKSGKASYHPLELFGTLKQPSGNQTNYVICDSGLSRKKQVRTEVMPPLRANTGAAYNNKVVTTAGVNWTSKGIEPRKDGLAATIKPQNGNQCPTAIINQKIRRLTPLEAERLQGFPEKWTAFGSDDKPISDTQRYKCLGNAVTVPVIEAIMTAIREKW